MGSTLYRHVFVIFFSIRMMSPVGYPSASLVTIPFIHSPLIEPRFESITVMLEIFLRQVIIHTYTLLGFTFHTFNLIKANCRKFLWAFGIFTPSTDLYLRKVIYKT